MSKILKLPTGISACLIVKDEEEMLPRCLESIKGAVDEIIVVDTGSTDKTVDIATNYLAKVFHYEWQDDFSAARNFAIEQASGEYVLIIDADEELAPESRAGLQAWAKRGLGAYAIHIFNKKPDGWGMTQSPRLFKRDVIHYEGIIHNNPIIDGEVVLSDLKLYHYGYNLSPEKMEAKYARSERLMLKAIQEKPTARLYQHLIRLYRATGKHVELELAVGEYKKDFMGDETPSMAARNQMIAVDYAYAMIMQDRFDAAIEELINLLDKYPCNIDASYYAGMAFMRRGEHFKALTYFRLYLTWMEQRKARLSPTALIIDTWGSVAQAHKLMGDCHARLGKLDRAHEAYFCAYVLDPCKAYGEPMANNMNKIELLRY